MTEPLSPEEIAGLSARMGSRNEFGEFVVECAVHEWSRFIAIATDHARLVEDYNALQVEHIDTTECFQLAMRERDALRATLEEAKP